jgi:hypothetical protein
MTTKKDFEIFLYKNKLNSKTLIDILPQLSSKTISNLYNDLEQLYKSKNTDKNIPLALPLPYGYIFNFHTIPL